MLTGMVIASLIAIAVTAIGIGVVYVRSYLEYRGKRVVTCPETKLPVGVEIEAGRAARGALIDNPCYVISSCTRWPERAGCDQACAPEVEASPRETLARTLVALWYDDHPCIYCGKQIEDLGGGAGIPALRGPDGELREWNAVPVEQLPELFRNAVAVCASCDVVESFRRQFPELVVERRRPVEPAPAPQRPAAIY